MFDVDDLLEDAVPRVDECSLLQTVQRLHRNLTPCVVSFSLPTGVQSASQTDTLAAAIEVEARSRLGGRASRFLHEMCGFAAAMMRMRYTAALVDLSGGSLTGETPSTTAGTNSSGIDPRVAMAAFTDQLVNARIAAHSAAGGWGQHSPPGTQRALTICAGAFGIALASTREVVAAASVTAELVGDALGFESGVAAPRQLVLARARYRRAVRRLDERQHVVRRIAERRQLDRLRALSRPARRLIRVWHNRNHELRFDSKLCAVDSLTDASDADTDDNFEKMEIANAHRRIEEDVTEKNVARASAAQAVDGWLRTIVGRPTSADHFSDMLELFTR